jgi:hypothetical protein
MAEFIAGHDEASEFEREKFSQNLLDTSSIPSFFAAGHLQP